MLTINIDTRPDLLCSRISCRECPFCGEDQCKTKLLEMGATMGGVRLVVKSEFTEIGRVCQ